MGDTWRDSLSHGSKNERSRWIRCPKCIVARTVSVCVVFAFFSCAHMLGTHL